MIWYAYVLQNDYYHRVSEHLNCVTQLKMNISKSRFWIISFFWLKKSSGVPPCPLVHARSNVGHSTLCLTLLLLSHHAFTPQTFTEHLCVPCSTLGAGDLEDSGLCLPGPYGSRLAFSSRAVMMMISLSRCAAWCHTFAPGFLLLLPLGLWWAPFLFSKLKSDLSLRGDFSISDDNHSIILYNLRKKEFIGRQSQGRSGESKSRNSKMRLFQVPTVRCFCITLLNHFV